MTIELVPPAMIALMRSINERNFDCTATVIADVETIVDGNTVKTPTTVAAAVPCRMVPYGNYPRENVLSDQKIPQQEWLVVFAANFPHTSEKYRYTISGTSAGVSWTRKVEVVGVKVPRSIQLKTDVVCREYYGNESN